MKNTFKKLITIISTASILLFNTLPALAWEVPSAPTPPPEPSLEESAPTPPPEPTPPPTPDAPTLQEMLSDDQAQPSTEEQETTPDQSTQDQSSGNTSSSEESTSETTNQPSSESQTSSGGQTGNQTGDQSADEQVGTTSLTTGTATNSVNIISDANNNLSGDIVGNPDEGGISVINSGNGSDSENSGSATVVEDSTKIQDNTASVTNSLTQITTSGDNSASKNVGDTTIQTGDANTTGTIINAVNTNIDGVMVAEFNVVDDQVGDLVLDFSANCIAGCSNGNLLAENSGNGAGSTNDAAVDLIQNNNTFQNNDATLLNEMNLSSNTGDNEADKNVGDSEIKTGDANVEANLLNFANNNIAGNVILGVVNIFGDLIGDIIFPEEYLSACSSCGGNLTAANIGNGADSQNSSSIDQTSSNTTFQKNDAHIENNILVDAQTGDNSASKNTGGDSEIKTGNASVDVNVLNVTNSNISGGDWWLVLVNEAGNWIGKILGWDGQNYAGSAGSEFIVNEYGEITAINSGNGADSQNSSSVSQQTNNTLSQTNIANIVNNVNLFASTGGNSASKNTGGSSSIQTGDANIVANIVNFVNNNISGGRLYVTVVNVFGSWVGDFVTPGSKKETAQAQSVGGPDNGNTAEESSNNATSNGSTNGNGNTSSNTSDNSSSTASPVTQTAPTRPSFYTRVAGFVSGVEAAGDPTDDPDNPAAGLVREVQKKKIKINLAWLLPLIPLTFLGLWLKRRVRVR